MNAPNTERQWRTLAAAAPTMTATMRRYLEQVGCVLRPASVAATDGALRSFAVFITGDYPQVHAVAQLQRSHVEHYKRWLTGDEARAGLSATTRSLRLGALRMFFLRALEWGWEDAPSRPLLFLGDLPPRDRPLPKALDDTDAGKFLRAAQAQPRAIIRVVAEVLLRTGLRVGELCALQRDAIRQANDGHWLHVPVGKLHDDRYLPLHPTLVTLIGDYRAAHVPATHPLLLPREDGRALDRACVTRMLNRIARAARIGHVHPHQLRHTLATQAKTGHEHGSDRRAARAPQPGHDPPLRADRRRHRRRRLLRRRRQSRRPLPAAPAHHPGRRTAPPGTGPPARQRLLHPTPPARLRT